MFDKSISYSERVNSCTLKSAFCFGWIIAHCDDFGRINGSPAKLKGQVFPLRREFSVPTIEKCLLELKNKELIYYWTPNGDPIIEIIDWWDHQTISEKKRTKSKFPAYDAKLDNSLGTPGNPKESPPKLREVKLSKSKSINKIKDTISKVGDKK